MAKEVTPKRGLDVIQGSEIDFSPEAVKRAKEARIAQFKSFYQTDNLTIQLWTGERFYEIDCEQLVDSAAVLDFAAQIHYKQWSNPDVLKEFFILLDFACNPSEPRTIQSVFCGSRCDHHVDWSTGRAIGKRKK